MGLVVPQYLNRTTQIILPGNANESYDFQFSIKAVIELKQITGGTVLVSPYLFNGGTPVTDNHAILSLTEDSGTYSTLYLNGTSSTAPTNQVSALDYTFTLTLPGSTNMTLLQDNIDLQFYENTDNAGNPVIAPGSETVQPYDGQFCELVLQSFDYNTHIVGSGTTCRFYGLSGGYFDGNQVEN